MINELLRKRILGLTGDASMLPPERLEGDGASFGPGVLSNQDKAIAEQIMNPAQMGQISDQQLQEQIEMYKRMMRDQAGKGAISDREMEIFKSTMPTEMPDMSREEQESMQILMQRGQMQEQAPMRGIAQEIAAQGEGEDTQLAHLKPGEVVLPPEFFEDDRFEAMVESKFKEIGVNPEEAVVGTGIATLNPITGLEQFGFFKKIGKKLKKVVKKVAPIAAFIPGVGTALGGVLGGIGGLTTKIPGIGGLLGKAGTFLSSTIIDPLAKAGIPGLSPIAGGVGQGFGGIGSGIQNPLAGGIFGQTGSTFAGGPSSGQGLANRFGLGSGTQSQVTTANLQTNAQNALNSLTPQQLAAMPAGQLQQLQQLAAGGGSGILGRLTGGSGGIGGAGGSGGGGSFLGGLGQALKVGGIGALAAGLGKLAYEDAKKQTGVPLTPLTTMSPTGRYNIEAEIARRMGQETPNPVEFGLLPANTFPELSGGKPAGMMNGGAVQGLQSGIQNMPSSRTPEMMMFSIDAEIQNLMTEYDMVVRNNELQRAQMIADQIDQLQQQKIQIQAQNEPSQKGIGSMQMMMYGGAVEDLTGGMASGMMYGGPVMAYAQGGAVQMQEGGGMDPSQFPRMDGDINGPGTETSDDIPAMLSDGEFVMTGQAVRGAGSYEMQSDPSGIISLMPTMDENRERGMDNMYAMMDVFASKAKES
jgi:hypothetical protein